MTPAEKKERAEAMRRIDQQVSYDGESNRPMAEYSIDAIRLFDIPLHELEGPIDYARRKK